MTLESAKVPREMGSSPCAERAPLFPPLHVNEMGIKAGVRAPPRNKMALFEQFTIPFSWHVPSHEVALRNPSPVQYGANDCHLSHLSSSIPANLESTNSINCEIGTKVRSSFCSSIGSLSTCSAIVNIDEAQRVQMQEPEEDTFPSLGVMHEQNCRTDKIASKGASKGVNGMQVVHQSRACGRPVSVALESFHDCEDSTAADTFNTKSTDAMEHSLQELSMNCEGLASAGSQLFKSENGKNEHNMDTHVLNCAYPKGSNQLKIDNQLVERHPSLGSNADPHQKPGVISQDDLPCIVRVTDEKKPIPSSSCEKMVLAMVIPLSVPVKPKDVINVVGQRLFWKARKAILRQQEVFSNQVFELHKLIKVQKLLARMQSPLIDECMLLGRTFDELLCDHLPNECVSNEQDHIGDQRAHAPAGSQKCVGPALTSKPQQKFVQCEESEAQKVRAGVVPIASFPQVLMNAPVGQPCHSLTTDGMSAWGYPMGPLNRPFIYPSGSSSIPSGAPFGGAYIVGPNPPVAPFAFPCYGQRPEQTSVVCPNNPWPSAMSHNPFFAPVINDWFAMNHQTRASFVPGSENAGPASSILSINMKADASTQCAQPGVLRPERQQWGLSRLMANRAVGSHVTASLSAPQNVVSRKPGASGQRQDRMDIDSSLGVNALNLFPLQPLSSSGGHSDGRISRQADCQGRVIKAVPHSPLAASESAAGILLSIQRERQL